MLSALFLSLTVLAEPTTATVLVRRTAISSNEATALMIKVSSRLAVPGLMLYPESQRRLSAIALKDGTNCGGKASCHAELGRHLGVSALVLVSVSQISKEQSLALELFDVASEAVLERESVLLPKRGEVPAALLEAFAARITERTTPRPVEPAPVEAPPEDAPKITTLVPAPALDVPPLLPPPPPRSHAAGVVLGGAALAAVGAGVGLLISSLNTRAPALAGTPGDDGRLRSELQGAQAEALNTSANVQLGVAGAAAVLGVALGVGAVLAW